jgi:hypothetical protein
MLRIFSLCIALTACTGDGKNTPVATQVTWSHATPPVRDWKELAKINVRVRSSETLASVWGTTYLYQDLTKARGWIQRENENYVLCFYAPEHSYGPDDGMPSGAWPTLFTYTIRDLPAQAKLVFREKCVPGANNSFKPRPLRGSA